MMTTEPIEKFILKSRNNLRIASTVGDAWPEVRARIVDEFFDRLEIHLKPKLKGWTFGRVERFGIDRYPSFDFWKTHWVDQYGVCLQPGEFGELVVIGVYREINSIGNRPFCSELLDAVKGKFKSAHVHRPWWEAKIQVQTPSSNWRKPEALWQIKNDTQVLQEIADQLLILAKSSAPIVDGLVRKYKK